MRQLLKLSSKCEDHTFIWAYNVRLGGPRAVFDEVVFKWLTKVITPCLVIGLKSRASFSTNEKQNQSHLVTVIFPALWASCGKLLGNVIGSSRWLLPLRLVKVIPLVLVFRQSFEKRSIKHRWVRFYSQTHTRGPRPNSMHGSTMQCSLRTHLV